MAGTGTRFPTFTSGQIKYTIGLQEEGNNIHVRTDREGHIASNIQGFIIKEISEIFNDGEVLVDVDYNTYSLINTGYNSTIQESSQRVKLILKSLYYGKKNEKNAA